jgi:hypothetical protein
MDEDVHAVFRGIRRYRLFMGEHRCSNWTSWSTPEAATWQRPREGTRPCDRPTRTEAAIVRDRSLSDQVRTWSHDGIDPPQTSDQGGYFLERVKSHLAQALAHEACRQGFEVLFINTHKMLSHLQGGRADGTFERRMAGYVRPDLLVLDDFGLKPLEPPYGPTDLFDVINERYEQGSILLTSNRAPAEWPDVFGNPLLASAGLDRLAHHAETVVITGTSFRARGGGLPVPGLVGT